ncbi:MAG: endolytic transglycosylase MltG [Acidobacteriota bacterium]|nr:endolytic transglycosylase MltG [Acidobacteriota bacterium]
MIRKSSPSGSSFVRRIAWRALAFTLVIVVVAGGVVAYLAKQLYDGAETSYRGYEEDAVIVDIRPGMSTTAIGRHLVAAGVVRNENTFRMAVWRSGRDRGLQAGEYRFAEATSALAVIDTLTQGQVYLRPITFPEGLTRRQMAEFFGASDFGSAEAFLAASERVELIAMLDSEAQNLEGYLFPETYSLPRGATADDLVDAMVTQFKITFDEDLRQRAIELELSVREVVTLASLIQRETGLDEERPIVSAVYTNRLRRRMPLQCDPTVIYALERAGLYDGNLTRENLRFDSPYNTYIYAGLPPGPIAAPGAADLRAALNPADVAHLYFVSRNDGSHVFADSLREHNRNVREYQVEYFRRRR